MRGIVLTFFLFVFFNCLLGQDGFYYLPYNRNTNDTIKIHLLDDKYILSGKHGLYLKSDLGTFKQKGDTLFMNSNYSDNTYSMCRTKDTTGFSLAIFSEGENITKFFTTNIEHVINADSLAFYYPAISKPLKLTFFEELVIPTENFQKNGKYIININDNFYYPNTYKLEMIMIYKNGNLYSNGNKWRKY